jgi:AhpD family alkylhydroperoxidase
VLSSEHGTLPLAPIDTPTSTFVRALYSITRKRYGKTPSAFRVIYARSAGIAITSLVIGIVFQYFLNISAELRTLVQLMTSLQNGCTFCEDITRAEAARAKIGSARFAELLEFEQSTQFTAREKAALAYARALHDSLHVSDAIWARMGEHFTERERIEIVWVCAVERYFNSMALPLRLGTDHLSDLYS